MNICLTVNSSPWSRFKGGGQIAVHQLATALTQQGHSVHVIYSKEPGETIYADTQYRIHWARHFNFATLNLNIFSFAWVLWKLVSRERFDLIHGNAEEAFFFSFIARVFSVRYVFTSHAPFIPKTAFWGGLFHPFLLLKRLNSYLLRSAAKRADMIFTFSQFSKNLVVNGLGPKFEKRVHVVIPGVDPHWFQTEHCPSSQPELIFWGRLEDEKGIPELLRAMERVKISHPGIVLHLIGEGNQENVYQNQAKKLGLSDQVLFHGWKEPSQIRTLASKCWVGIFPSRIESFGLTVVEAMAAGLPVIATTAGALPEIVENDHTGILVSIKNPSHLGDAIIKLLTQSWLRPKLSQSGCNAVRQKYSWNHTANTLATFYAKHD